MIDDAVSLHVRPFSMHRINLYVMRAMACSSPFSSPPMGCTRSMPALLMERTTLVVSDGEAAWWHAAARAYAQEDPEAAKMWLAQEFQVRTPVCCSPLPTFDCLLEALPEYKSYYTTETCARTNTWCRCQHCPRCTLSAQPRVPHAM